MFLLKARRVSATFMQCLVLLFLCALEPEAQRNIQAVGTTSAPVAGTGSYYALIIGNENYTYLPKLQTPLSDANAVEKLLRDVYGFHTKKILNATRTQIITVLAEYRSSLPENSSLLIYYAGHGHHDHDTGVAYWLPVDAQSNNPANWISASDVTENIKAIPSAHVLVISDSCYSGYLTRGDEEVGIQPGERSKYLAKLVSLPSRTLMSSGGDEPVADNGAPGHSIFAWAVLQSLTNMSEDEFTASELFQNGVQQRVAARSNQLPQYSLIRNSIRDSDRDIGDFVFHRAVATPHPAVAIAPPPVEASKSKSASIVSATPQVVPPSSVLKSASGHLLGLIVGHGGCQFCGVVLRTEDGSNWQEVEAGESLGLLMSVVFVNRQSGWAAGDKGLYHSEDGGQSWQKWTPNRILSREVEYPPNYVSVSFVGSQLGWVATSGGLILHTDDAGQKWDVQNRTNITLSSLTFIDSHSGWAVGDHGVILHTENGGSTWTQQTSGTGESLTAVAFITPQSGWTVGQSGVILHTDNGGATWHRQNSKTDIGLKSVFFVTPYLGWAVGWDSIILHTSDAGATWTEQDGGNTCHHLNGVTFINPREGWAVGDPNCILHTSDGGSKWEGGKYDTPYSFDLMFAAFPGAK